MNITDATIAYYGWNPSESQLKWNVRQLLSGNKGRLRLTALKALYNRGPLDSVQIGEAINNPASSRQTVMDLRDAGWDIPDKPAPANHSGTMKEVYYLSDKDRDNARFVFDLINRCEGLKPNWDDPLHPRTLLATALHTGYKVGKARRIETKAEYSEKRLGQMALNIAIRDGNFDGVRRIIDEAEEQWKRAQDRKQVAEANRQAKTKPSLITPEERANSIRLMPMSLERQSPLLRLPELEEAG